MNLVDGEQTGSCIPASEGATAISRGHTTDGLFPESCRSRRVCILGRVSSPDEPTPRLAKKGARATNMHLEKHSSARPLSEAKTLRDIAENYPLQKLRTLSDYLRRHIRQI